MRHFCVGIHAHISPFGCPDAVSKRNKRRGLRARACNTHKDNVSQDARARAHDSCHGRIHAPYQPASLFHFWQLKVKSSLRRNGVARTRPPTPIWQSASCRQCASANIHLRAGIPTRALCAANCRQSRQSGGEIHHIQRVTPRRKPNSPLARSLHTPVGPQGHGVFCHFQPEL